MAIVWIVLAGVVVVGFLVLVAMRPGEFEIKREGVVEAGAGEVFGLLNDFHEWERWSPWEKLDPGMKKTFSGAASGKGAVYSWVGNKKAGEGRMTIEESVAGERVGLKIEFLKPFAATNRIEFLLVPVEVGTRVTWRMAGRKNFVMKGFCMFMDMDKVVGKDFEEGLGNMRRVVGGTVAR